MSQATIQLHERLFFDLPEGQVLDGQRRYIIMRPDVLMGTFDKLEPAAREAALTALGASVTEFGGNSVAAYLAEAGRDALLQNMVAGSASLGWGVWTFEQPDPERQELRLQVRNSPFAAGTHSKSGPACFPIAGMLRAVAQALWSEPAEVIETSCACQSPSDPQHAQGVCHFHAVPQHAKSKLK